MIDKDLTPREVHNISLEVIVPTVVFLLSILVSFVELQAAYYFWIVIIPAKKILHKRSFLIFYNKPELLSNTTTIGLGQAIVYQNINIDLGT